MIDRLRLFAARLLLGRERAESLWTGDALSEAQEAMETALLAQSVAEEALAIVRQHTVHHVDVSPTGKTPHVIITLGQWRNHSVVDIHSIHGEEFGHLMEHMQALRRTGRAGYIDAPPAMRAVFDHTDW